MSHITYATGAQVQPLDHDREAPLRRATGSPSSLCNSRRQVHDVVRETTRLYSNSRTQTRRRRRRSEPSLILLLLSCAPLILCHQSTTARAFSPEATFVLVHSSRTHSTPHSASRERSSSRSSIITYISNNGAAPSDSEPTDPARRRRRRRLTRQKQQQQQSLSSNNNRTSSSATLASEASQASHTSNQQQQQQQRQMELLQRRMSQLEQLVATQAVELKRLKDKCRDLTEAAQAFARVVELLRDAGLQMDDNSNSNKKRLLSQGKKSESIHEAVVVESFEDSEIFGKAPPSSVIEAADVAGASILAGMLAGKHRMLVDVRDAELNTNPETLVQFIELAVLPVAAGIEGLKSKRNRLKIVFPTVSQLLEYRRTMALAAPEVVALSTLGFDPVEPQDSLVVIVAPAPNDEAGLSAMYELLEPTDPNRTGIDQPVVVLNHHMVPISGPATSYDVAYHLRLLSVQYMSGEKMPEVLQQKLEEAYYAKNSSATTNSSSSNDAALETAMKHAYESGAVHQGVTRAMVIRAYPQPWYVFVDTSPDTDADFEVAATFDEEPSLDEVNNAIVECLEGSEREDEIVAQQMQQALEEGQLDRVSDVLGSMGMDVLDDEDEEDDDDDDYWDLFHEDSV